LSACRQPHFGLVIKEIGIKITLNSRSNGLQATNDVNPLELRHKALNTLGKDPNTSLKIKICLLVDFQTAV